MRVDAPHQVIYRGVSVPVIFYIISYLRDAIFVTEMFLSSLVHALQLAAAKCHSFLDPHSSSAGFARNLLFLHTGNVEQSCVTAGAACGVRCDMRSCGCTPCDRSWKRVRCVRERRQ